MQLFKSAWRRRTEPSCWEFFRRENDADGNRTRQTAGIGTLEQFPTKDLAHAGVNGLKKCLSMVNEYRNRERKQSRTGNRAT
jgi:hypothetical protein